MTTVFDDAGTAEHVERIVRGWRRVDRIAEAKQSTQRHRSRTLHVYQDEDGMGGHPRAPGAGDRERADEGARSGARSAVSAYAGRTPGHRPDKPKRSRGNVPGPGRGATRVRPAAGRRPHVDARLAGWASRRRLRDRRPASAGSDRALGTPAPGRSRRAIRTSLSLVVAP